MSDKHSSDESESEEPTEKEGLLDLAWERQQAKVIQVVSPLYYNGIVSSRMFFCELSKPIYVPFKVYHTLLQHTITSQYNKFRKHLSIGPGYKISRMSFIHHGSSSIWDISDLFLDLFRYTRSASCCAVGYMQWWFSWKQCMVGWVGEWGHGCSVVFLEEDL